MLPKRLIVVDVETTGIDPSTDSIVQIASCILDPSDLQEERSFSSYVHPESRISPEAKAIHGLSQERLIGAPTLDQTIREFDRFAPQDGLLCGHNVAFDIAFIKNAYKKVGLQYVFDYHSVDLWSLAFFILSARQASLASYDLSSLSRYFGVKRGTKHDALEDVRATADILRFLFAAVTNKSESEVTRYHILHSR